MSAAMPRLDQAWARSVQVEIDRHTPHARFLTGVQSVAHHQIDFGLVVSVTALPPGSLEPDWLVTGEGNLLTAMGERTWNSLLTLAQELADHPATHLDGFAAVFLHPKAITAAREALLAPQGGKKEAA
ncbi:hypothetical protein [Caulobacter sp. BK020]|uniref:hypothetical protein n=1 Tax=Caulobacter sp. BK020 TaxID=2512117 RepID=UPI001052F8BE|nr:hypothetical protein [Caulobacter sp. BK020]TCS14571.1 hypothetical protein EV278_107220 [Caulobacter sp. BK020]